MDLGGYLGHIDGRQPRIGRLVTQTDARWLLGFVCPRAGALPAASVLPAARVLPAALSASGGLCTGTGLLP